MESDKKLMVLKKGMSLNYQHHWIVDNMPVTWCYPLENDRQFCSTGFPMGCLVRHHPDGVRLLYMQTVPLIESNFSVAFRRKVVRSIRIIISLAYITYSIMSTLLSRITAVNKRNGVSDSKKMVAALFR